MIPWSIAARRLILPALAVIAVAAVAMLPQTAWLARNQVAVLVGGDVPGGAPDGFGTAGSGRSGLPADFKRRVQAVAAENPRDYHVQMAAALVLADDPAADNDDDDIWRRAVVRLLPLRARFDGEPGLHAVLLRYEMMHFCPGRNDDELLVRPNFAVTHGSTDPAQFVVGDAEARRGEELDPYNAFFPYMRSALLLATCRDADAAKELRRAAAAPRWDSYAVEEVTARRDLLHRVFGHTSIIADRLLSGYWALPAASMRETARLFPTLAMLREIRGGASGGYAIRHDLARVGATMRATATDAAEEDTATFLVDCAALRPGGAAPIHLSSPPHTLQTFELHVTPTQLEQERSYEAYLRRTGHPTEAEWYRDERAADRQAAKPLVRWMNDPAFDRDPTAVLLAEWGIGMLLLVNGVWALLFGGVSALIVRTRRLRSGAPLPRGVACGLILATLNPIVIAILSWLYDYPAADDNRAWCALSAALLVVPVPLLLLRQKTGWGEYALAILGALVTEVCVYAIVVAVDLSATGAATYVHTAASQLFDVSLFYRDANASTPDTARAVLGAIFAVAAAATAAPFTIAALFATTAWRRGFSAGVGALRGMATATPVLLGVLLLSYTALVVTTAHQEQVVGGREQRRLTHAGRYYASLLGQEWPGRVADR